MEAAIAGLEGKELKKEEMTCGMTGMTDVLVFELRYDICKAVFRANTRLVFCAFSGLGD